MKAMLLAACSLWLSGCAVLDTLGGGADQLERRIDTALKRHGLLPRVEQLGEEADAWREQRCYQKALPALQVTQHDMFPGAVAAGSNANHRFTYALCPSAPDIALQGDLVRRIYYQGRQILSDATRGAELKPGIWRVDAFFEIPPSAVAGSYEVEVQFTHPSAGFRERTAFYITAPPAAAGN